MPVDMMRAPKVGPTPKPMGFESVELRCLDQGYEVTVRAKQPPPKDNGPSTYVDPKVYAFADAPSALKMLASVVGGDDLGAYGEGATPETDPYRPTEPAGAADQGGDGGASGASGADDHDGDE